MKSKIIIEIQDLNVSFKDQKVIENVDLQIEKGKVYGIIGPNGCGKTTFMRALSRNIKPERGRVLLYGDNILKMKTKKIARKMAVLSQFNSASLSDVNVRSLVQYGRFSHKSWWKGAEKEDNEIVDWAIEKTGLENLQNRKIQTLSGGERQRAWIAMAIAQKPEILLLDEPTTYLDISHQLEIMELISKLNEEEKITIIMVLHDINHAARYCDELIVFKNKRIVSKGSPWVIIESQALQNVFNVEAQIIKDQDNDKPIFYATKVTS